MVFCSNCKQLVDADENKAKMREREITRLFQIPAADIIISFLAFLLALVLSDWCVPVLLCGFFFMITILTFKSKVL